MKSHFYSFVGCDAIKHNEEDQENVEERRVAGATHTNRVGDSSGKTKTDNGYEEEHLHAKSSSVMHEETSDDSYLQVKCLHQIFILPQLYEIVVIKPIKYNLKNNILCLSYDRLY